MQILISDSSKSQLLGNTNQPFLIINLINNFFILTKAANSRTIDKNINFEIQGIEFYSTFARHVNLAYAAKLSQLVENLGLGVLNNPSLQHQWIMLYEIHDFQENNTFRFKLGIPAYGEEVIVHSWKGTFQMTRVSNLFRFHGETFYFLSCSPSCCQQLAIITDKQQKYIYGITYFAKDITICLPFHCISSQKPCPINILPSIKPLLQSTCYVVYNRNYCTGFVLQENIIVSARHVLPFQEQRAGLEVKLRFYPYNEQKIGYVIRIGQGSVDIIVIEVQKNIVVKNLAANLQRGNSLEMKVDEQKLVGKEILTLGFGKYNYSSRVFTRVDAVFPTVQSGIISKIINLGHSNVFIKTDANLYNGFSGCGVWLGVQLIGMAVFILKNSNSYASYNKHNFSYSLRFILDLFKKDTKQFLISEINAELKYFDKIQTRHRFTLHPKL